MTTATAFATIMATATIMAIMNIIITTMMVVVIPIIIIVLILLLPITTTTTTISITTAFIIMDVPPAVVHRRTTAYKNYNIHNDHYHHDHYHHRLTTTTTTSPMTRRTRKTALFRRTTFFQQHYQYQNECRMITTTTTTTTRLQQTINDDNDNNQNNNNNNNTSMDNDHHSDITTTTTTTTTTTNIDDQNNRIIIIQEWIQKFQHLLHLTSSVSSSSSSSSLSSSVSVSSLLLSKQRNDTNNYNNSTVNVNLNDNDSRIMMMMMTKNEQELRSYIQQVFISNSSNNNNNNNSNECNNNNDDDTNSSNNHNNNDWKEQQQQYQYQVAYWRDMIAMTWNIITLEGISQITQFLLSSQSSVSSTTNWVLDPSKSIVCSTSSSTNLPIQPTTTASSSSRTSTGTLQQQHQQQQSNQQHEMLEFWCTFTTNAGNGRAQIRLIKNVQQEQHNQQQEQEWKAYTVFTSLQSLHDRPWYVAPNHRSYGIQHGIVPNRIYWHEEQEMKRNNIQNNGIQQPYVIIIGGGQGGLSLGARLQYLHIPYIIYECGTTPGTSWKQRYPNLYLHDPIYYNYMPYIEYPITWPIFAPRNKVANFMECYVQLLDLCIVCNTKVIHAKQDMKTKLWSVDIETRIIINNNENDDDTTTTNNRVSEHEHRIVRKTIQCTHIVFATGNSSSPRKLSNTIKNQKYYTGIIIHTSQYKGGKYYLNLMNKKRIRHVIVIGSNNSAFDICQDIYEQMSIHNSDGNGTVETITMIQRTTGMVVSTESVLQYGLGPLYSENATLHHEEADIVASTIPYKIAITDTSKWQRIAQLMKQNDATMLEQLQKAGYQLDDGPYNCGIFAKSATEGGGFYIDHGCASLIIRGDVTVKYATIESFGTDTNEIMIRNIHTNIVETLPADMIICATGYNTMDEYVKEICGIDVAQKVGRTWGLGLGYNIIKDPGPWDGELRNMWKPTNVNGLWFQGGNLAQNRYYSRYLALQLAARYMKIEAPVYGIPKPTPSSYSPVTSSSIKEVVILQNDDDNKENESTNKKGY